MDEGHHEETSHEANGLCWEVNSRLMPCILTTRGLILYFSISI
jgi:hypothetical protein